MLSSNTVTACSPSLASPTTKSLESKDLLQRTSEVRSVIGDDDPRGLFHVRYHRLVEQ